MRCWGLWRPCWEGSPLGSVPRVHGTPQLCFSNAIQMKAERGNPVSLGIALKCREKLFLWIVSFGFLAAEWHTVSVSWSICLSFAWLSSSIARQDRFLLLILLVLALEQKFSLWKTFVYAKLSCRWCLWIPKHGLICLNFLDYSWAVYFHLSESCSSSLPVHSYVPAPDFPSGFESSLCGSSETVPQRTDGTLGDLREQQAEPPSPSPPPGTTSPPAADATLPEGAHPGARGCRAAPALLLCSSSRTADCDLPLFNVLKVMYG